MASRSSEHDIPLAGRVSPDVRFDAVMEEYGRLLRAAVARLCPRDMTAECDDIRQEAYLRVWRAVAAGREIQSPASYIYRAAATATIDAIRRVKARREQALEAGAESEQKELQSETVPPDKAAEHRQIIEKTVRLLAAASPDRRRAVTLHLQGLTTQEIGDLLGWSEAKARNLVYRTLGDLRSRLRAEGIDYAVE
jgi:RNA polymerase sigma-70 factor (ECF subfamily)